jgi:5,10-methylenetetrahydrofolate reductase
LIKKINGVVGNFILDTGASNSCVGLKALPYFNFKQKIQKCIWAGATGMQTQMASNNELQLGFWKHLEFDVVILIYLM